MQEATRIGRRLSRIEATETPPRRPVDGEKEDEEVSPPVLISHARLVFDVDMQITRLVGLDGPMRGLDLLRPQLPQIAHAMARVLEPKAHNVVIDAGTAPARTARRLRNARTTARKASSGRRKVLRSAPATASWVRDQGCLKPVWRVAPVVRCLDCAMSRLSVRRCHGVLHPPRPAPDSPGSPPGFLASSSPACDGNSACPIPIPNPAQDRSCDEKSRPVRVYMVIGDGPCRRLGLMGLWMC